jgi:hypothetical protein
MHLKETSTAFCERAGAMAAALRSADNVADTCIIAVTGDIAYSGKAAEFALARSFLDALRANLETQDRFKGVVVFMVPGNHDCDFGQNRDLRDLVLEGLNSGRKSLKDGKNFLLTLLSVQKEFFQFQRQIGWPVDCEEPWFHFHDTFGREKALVLISAYNTALMSSFKETQGQLRFPVELVSSPLLTSGSYDLMLTMFHHPYNWLESANSRQFRKHVERTSDLVLTGHEHESGSFKKQNTTGEELQYIEGATLQEDGPAESQFNVIVCDLDEQKHKLTQFKWDAGRYMTSVEGKWVPFLRNSAARRQFENSPAFIKVLEDVGTGFTHPRRAQLTLKDIFVYPDLTHHFLLKARVMKNSPEFLTSDKVLAHITEHERVLIIGGDQSGKTCLAHTLYTDLQAQPLLTPLLLSGREIVNHEPDTFFELVEKSFAAQYSPLVLDAFNQLPREKRVLIVDDWHQTKLNEAGQKLVLEAAQRFFGKIVVIAGDIFRIRELWQHEWNPSFEFDRCEIREFGHFLRGRLIERWYSLGQEYSSDEARLRHDVDQAERLIATLLGKNLIPSYPVNVLAVLQACEAGKTANAPAGSYGYLYEVLITSALATVSKELVDLDTMYAFLGRIAYHLFHEEKPSLTAVDAQRLAEDYFQGYGIRLDSHTLLQNLEQAKLLSVSGGNYSFRYRYLYYFFVAKSFQEALRDPSSEASARNELKVMADRVNYEEYANILLFVIYLTKDVDLIQHMLTNAETIYGKYQPCDFEGDVEFINRLYKEPPKVILPATDLRENLEEYRRRLDEAAQSEEETQTHEDDKVKYDEQLGELVKLNIALKTLRLIGQVLRNFPGSLPRKLKARITETCYQLGLRTLNAVFKIAETNFEDFRSYIAQLIKEHRSFDTDRELEESTDKEILWLSRRCGFAMIKRISYAVGLEILESIYKDVLQQESGKVSVSLIDLSVKLDHFKGFPERDIERMNDRLQKNYFAGATLRDLVANHLYLFPVDYTIRQRMGQRLDIQTSAPKYLTRRAKKVKGRRGGKS